MEGIEEVIENVIDAKDGQKVRVRDAVNVAYCIVASGNNRYLKIIFLFNFW